MPFITSLCAGRSILLFLTVLFLSSTLALALPTGWRAGDVRVREPSLQPRQVTIPSLTSKFTVEVGQSSTSLSSSSSSFLSTSTSPVAATSSSAPQNRPPPLIAVNTNVASGVASSTTAAPQATASGQSDSRAPTTSTSASSIFPSLSLIFAPSSAAGPLSGVVISPDTISIVSQPSSTAEPTPSATIQASAAKSPSLWENKGAIAAIFTLAGIVIFILGLFFCLLRRQNKRQRRPQSALTPFHFEKDPESLSDSSSISSGGNDYTNIVPTQPPAQVDAPPAVFLPRERVYNVVTPAAESNPIDDHTSQAGFAGVGRPKSVVPPRQQEELSVAVRQSDAFISRPSVHASRAPTYSMMAALYPRSSAMYVSDSAATLGIPVSPWTGAGPGYAQ